MVKKPRIKVKSKWVQGNQIVLNTHLVYPNEEKDVQMSFPVEVLKNRAQFNAMLEEAYEQNRTRTDADLSNVPDEIEQVVTKMDKGTLEDLKRMTKMYKKLAKSLKLSLTDTLLIVASRELIILNEEMKKKGM